MRVVENTPHNTGEHRDHPHYCAGAVSLGLIGGAGTVVYDNDDKTTTVKIDEHNTPADTTDDVTVKLKGNGKNYMCDQAVIDKLEPGDIEIGRVKITMRRAKAANRDDRREIRAIKNANPGDTLDPTTYDRYMALIERDNKPVARINKLVNRHNVLVEENNATLKTECQRDEAS